MVLRSAFRARRLFSSSVSAASLAPPPVLRQHGRFTVLRDDLCPGGTKRRVLERLITSIPQDEIVYPGHAFGYAALAMALAAAPHGKRVHVLYPSPKAEDVAIFEETIAQPNLTWSLHDVVLQHHLLEATEQYAHEHGAYLMPIGCKTDEFRQGLVDFAKTLPITPEEVWLLAGSGLLTSALSEAWPKARINAVSLGMKHLEVDESRVKLYHAPEKPEQPAEVLPPYPSALYYDAKVWRFAEQHGSEGALIWTF